MRTRCLLMVIAAGAGLVQAQGGGEISGAVLDEAGRPVMGAFVTYLRTPYATNDKVPVGDGQYTDGMGRFLFTKLIAATYTFCVQTPPERGSCRCATGR